MPERKVGDSACMNPKFIVEFVGVWVCVWFLHRSPPSSHIDLERDRCSPLGLSDMPGLFTKYIVIARVTQNSGTGRQ